MHKNFGVLKLNKKGFTLVEAVVAALVFAAVAVGIFATTSALKTPAVRTDKKLIAAFYAKQILEDLRAKVDQRDWDTGPLRVGFTTTQTITNPTNNVTYTLTYVVTSMLPASNARKVVVTVAWPD